ncbi:MAG: hypothetical protein BWY75_01627 [bacterium ADurb.Bin425]|nr:MAG: hypothetical protein BWY75_01627 [bacterium ADurb.Bin425]
MDVALVGGQLGAVLDQDVGECFHLVLALLGPHDQVAAALAAMRLERRADDGLRHHRRHRDHVVDRQLDDHAGTRLGTHLAEGDLGGQLVADGEVGEFTQLAGRVREADLVQGGGHDVHAHVVDRVLFEDQCHRAVAELLQLVAGTGAQQVDLLGDAAVADHHGREAHHHVLAEGRSVEQHAAHEVGVDLREPVGVELRHQLFGGHLLLAQLDGVGVELERAGLVGSQHGLADGGGQLLLQPDHVMEDVVTRFVTEERQVDRDEVEHLVRNLHGVGADRSARARDGGEPHLGDTAEEDVADALGAGVHRRGAAVDVQVAAPVELVALLEEEGDRVEQAGVLAVAQLLEAVGVHLEDVDDLRQLFVEHLDGLLDHRVDGGAGVLLLQLVDDLGQRLAVAVLQLGQLLVEAVDGLLVLVRHVGASPVDRRVHLAEARLVERVELTLDHQFLQTVGALEHDLTVGVGLAGLAGGHDLVDLEVGQVGQQRAHAFGLAGGLGLLLAGLAGLGLLGGTLHRLLDQHIDGREGEVFLAFTANGGGGVAAVAGGGGDLGLADLEREIELGHS